MSEEQWNILWKALLNVEFSEIEDVIGYDLLLMTPLRDQLSDKELGLLYQTYVGVYHEETNDFTKQEDELSR